jgi:hypothetical protein
MKSTTCRLLGLLMLGCAVVAIWFAAFAPGRSQVELDQETARIRQTADELDRTLERQRLTVETIAMLQCQRDGCTKLPPTSKWDECRTTVMVNGLPRSRNCSR